MKFIFVVAALWAVATAAPVDEAPVQIIISQVDQQPDGSYSFRYETSDGSTRQETGVVREVLDENNKLQRVIVVTGSYGFYNNEGKFETINYSADENGYQAQGDSVPSRR